MTGITYRAERIQNAAVNWLEDKRRKSEQRQQHADIYRQRMTCSDSLRFDTQTQDWTGGMGISPSGRFQVIENVKPRKRIIDSEGIRWDAAWIAIFAVALVCAAILLADLAGIGTGGRTITKLTGKIEEITKDNEKLRTELAVSAGDVSVCTEAVKLNLISGSGAQTILLTAPQEANLTMTTAAAQRTGE